VSEWDREASIMRTWPTGGLLHHAGGGIRGIIVGSTLPQNLPAKITEQPGSASKAYDP